jgi:hypothetical protein
LLNNSGDLISGEGWRNPALVQFPRRYTGGSADQVVVSPK